MSSTVPAVLDALVELWRGALDGVQVADGEPLETENDLIVVGYTDVVGEAAVINTRTREQMAEQPDRESYDVACIASSWSGVADFKTPRDAAYGLLRAAEAALAADSRLGGLVMQTRLATEDLVQEPTDKGVMATVRFTVHVEAFGR